VADSVVKVFDLRTLRQLPPAPFMGGGAGGSASPAFASFLPSFSSTLFAASPGGALRLVEARGADATQYFQVGYCTKRGGGNCVCAPSEIQCTRLRRCAPQRARLNPCEESFFVKRLKK
jgi:hypothetical protein